MTEAEYTQMIDLLKDIVATNLRIEQLLEKTIDRSAGIAPNDGNCFDVPK